MTSVITVRCGCGVDVEQRWGVNVPRHVCDPSSWPATDAERIVQLTKVLEELSRLSWYGELTAGGYKPFQEKGKVYFTMLGKDYRKLAATDKLASEVLMRCGANRETILKEIRGKNDALSGKQSTLFEKKGDEE